MKKPLFLILLIVYGIVALTAQGLESEDELYLADPAPRFHGDQVVQLQTFLRFHGMDLGPDGIDGWFGRDTHAALLAYQEKYGLPQTGRIPVADFQGPLVWNPFVSIHHVEGPFPSPNVETRRQPVPSHQAVILSSSQGSLALSRNQVETIGAPEFLYSPDQRFVGALGRNGGVVYLWDLFTGTSLEYPVDITKVVDPESQWAPYYEDIRAEEIFWWNDPINRPGMELEFYVATRYRYRGNDEGSYFTVTPLFPAP